MELFTRKKGLQPHNSATDVSNRTQALGVIANANLLYINVARAQF